jgi:class 3 adenylate cyclase
MPREVARATISRFRPTRTEGLTRARVASTIGPMGSIERKSLRDPDELREFELGTGELVRVGAQAIARAALEPGWRWSTHMGPVMGTPSCPVHHVQVLLSGRFAVRMDDGEEVELAPDDVFDIPPGHDAWVLGDEPVVLLDVSGNTDVMGVPQGYERVVTTLLMTDIVDSTRLASLTGDAAWKQVLADHNRLVRRQLDRFRGTEVNTTGDGFLATFDSAAGALRCAAAIRDTVGAAGVEVRIGVHTGEVELLPSDIGGIAVHAVARIMALAGPSEVLASSTTVALADGAGLAFEDRGRHELKGLDRPLELHRLLA